MIIFALLTIKNIRQIRRINNNNNQIETIFYKKIFNTKDRQIILMLFFEILLYILFNCLSSIYLIYQQITKYEIKPIENQFISSIILFVLFLPYSINFYTNYIVSKNFRQEIKKKFF